MSINQVRNDIEIQQISSQLEGICGVETYSLSSNSSFPAVERQGLCFLIEGVLNCFYSSMNHQGASTSRLFNLNSYRPGDFFLTAYRGFQAIPAVDVRCLYIPFSSIQTLEDNHLLSILSNAIDEAIRNSDSFLRSADQYISDENSTSALIWYPIDSTGCDGFGVEEIPFSATPCYLPKIFHLSPKDPSENQIDLSLLTTTELIGNALFENSITALFILLDQKIAKWHCETLKSGSILLDNNKNLKKQVLTHSIKRFARLLKEEEKNDFSHPIPLFHACQVLGEKIGIQFHLSDHISSSNDELLKDIARASHVRMRQVTLEDDWFHKRSGSLLAFWEENDQPVCLLSIGNKQYQIYDPQTNDYQKVSAEISSKLSEQAFMFYRPLPERSLSSKDLIDYALLDNSKDMWMLFLMSCGIGIIGLFVPLATGMVFDDLIPNSNTIQLWELGFGLLVAALTVAAFQYTQGIAINRLEGLISAPLESALWDRVLNLPSTFFRQYGAGDLAGRLYSIRNIHQLVSGSVVSSLLALGAGLFNFALMFYIAWKLALLATVLSLILITIVVVGFLFQLKYYNQMTEINIKIQAHTLQIFNAIARLKINGCEIFAFNSWTKQYAKQKQNTLSARKIANQVDAFTSTASLFSLGCFIFVITYYHQQEFSVGEFLKFSSAYAIFLSSMLMMASTVMSIGMVGPLFKMLKPILTETPEIDSQKKHPGQLVGHLELSKLDFSYNKDGPKIISDFCLTINAGAFVAIVGASGSGKSTLLRLLLGFEKPQQGSILYDNQELEHLDILEVRRQLGVVLQDGHILSGSIMQNIKGAYNCTSEQAINAAKLAGLSDDIEKMPMKYETIVRDGVLSGGQQQRLLIARAIVNEPNMLFFDEATSALDNKTQSQVSKSLDNLKATRIVIAHRLSTIKHADIIVVMEKGKIIQQGNYNALIQQQGLFSELVKRQMI
ncbi:MAG: NHLP bacteriocin export ABC transporter permease/ATPase subunit [Gammaproteobacteria bacterium]|nr:NHLP bacteriocin export ABC transporter permease/ATPase subunit [Gammaproteobacteria bacterium]